MPKSIHIFTRYRYLVGALALVTTTSCVSVYGQAMKRGNQYAEASMWDQAAQQFSLAHRDNPEDPRALVRLREARHHQATDRLTRARVFLQRGAFKDAVRLADEASRILPNSPDVQTEVNRVLSVTVSAAQQALKAGDFLQALKLSSWVLGVVREHPQARQVHDQAQAWFVQKEIQDAQASYRDGQLGTAVLQLAHAELQKPTPDLTLDQQVHAWLDQLREQITFRVVLRPGPNNEQDQLSSVISVEALKDNFRGLPLVEIREGQNIKSGGLRAPVQVASGSPSPPTNAASSTSHPSTMDPIHDPPSPSPPQARSSQVVGGLLAVSGSVHSGPFYHRISRVMRTCSYVCGYDTRINPARATAQREADDADARISRAQEQVDRQQERVDEQQRRIDRVQEDVTRAEKREAHAQERLDRCQRRNSRDKDNGHRACRSERRDLRSAREDLRRARDRMDSPRTRLRSLRRELESARREVSRIRSDKTTALENLSRLPLTIREPRMCQRRYEAAIHGYGIRATVISHGVDLESHQTLLDQRFPYSVTRSIETYRRAPGQCPRHGRGLLSPPPTEQALRTMLAEGIAKRIARELVAKRKQRRNQWLQAAKSARGYSSAASYSVAWDACVRYLLSGDPSEDPPAQRAWAIGILEADFGKQTVRMLGIRE